jgi:hypothetical protein
VDPCLSRRAGTSQSFSIQEVQPGELQTAAFAHGLEQCQDPRRTGIGVEAEPEVMYEGEALSVVRLRVYGRGRPLKGASGVPSASWMADE